MSAIVLYDFWRSSASYRVRIALNLKGLPYRSVAVDLPTKAHKSSEHLARNPQGLVPVLEIDGQLRTQSLAILEYLDETRPEPPLLPRDPDGRARARALALAIAMEIHPICNVSVAEHVVEIAGGGGEARVAWMRRFIRPGLEAFDAMLARAEPARFCHGDQPGLADCCLVPQLYNAERWGVAYADLPHVARVAQALSALEAVREAHPDRVRPPDAR